jgi:hypothetical protein
MYNGSAAEVATSAILNGDLKRDKDIKIGGRSTLGVQGHPCISEKKLYGI